MKGRVVLQVEHVGKKFTRHLKGSMAHGVQDLLRDMVGVGSYDTAAREKEFWAVKDVSLELRKGEILGITGLNGSGKTTLMRLIAGVYPLDTGSVKIDGRFTTMFATTKGMHPHYSGRENIYVKGSMFGMSRKEIDDKMDSIIQFAELEDVIDSPLGNYSSGMKARLGFSIAIATNPDLFIIDEGLVVGDYGFKQKCYRYIRNNAHRTAVIFVTSSKGKLKRVATRMMIMEGGQIALDTGKVKQGLAEYAKHYIHSRLEKSNIRKKKKEKTDLLNLPFRHKAPLVVIQFDKMPMPAFKKQLYSQYGDEELLTINIKKDRSISVQQMGGSVEELNIYPEVIFCRLASPGDITEVTGSAKNIITWIPHPVERVLRNYFSLKKRMERTARKFRKEPMVAEKIHLSIEEFINEPHSQNWISRFVNSQTIPLFTFIGLKDQYAEDIAWLKRHLGWEEVEHVPRQQALPEISPDIIEQIKALNQVDLAVYEEVVKWRKKTLGISSPEIKFYQGVVQKGK